VLLKRAIAKIEGKNRVSYKLGIIIKYKFQNTLSIIWKAINKDAKEMIIDSIRFTKQKQVIILDIIKSYYSNQKYLLIMQKTPNKRFYFLIFVI